MTYVAKMVTGTVANKNAFKAISNGRFRIQIDNVASTIDGLNFTSIIGYDDIAEIIQSAIRSIGDSGYVNATVTASANAGNDVFFTFSSGTDAFGSYVSTMLLEKTTPGTDISGVAFLNGQNGSMLIDLFIYAVSTVDIESIKNNNVTNSGTLSIMMFFNLNINGGAKTPHCIEKCVIEMPEYINWRNDLNAIRPFSERDAAMITIDNN